MQSAHEDTRRTRRHVNASGVYYLLRDGEILATITVSRSWNGALYEYTASLRDGWSVIRSDGVMALVEAMRKVAPGQLVWPWYPGCSEAGFRVQAEGLAPWDVV